MEKQSLDIVRVHRENNCFGSIMKDYHEECTCHNCENWTRCGSGGTQYYKCDKCDYKYSAECYPTYKGTFSK